MRKDRRLKPKEDVTSAEGFSRTSAPSKYTKASPSAKSSASNAEHLSLRRVTSLSLSGMFGSLVEEDQGQEANHSAPDLPAQPAQSIGGISEPESPKDFARKPCLNLPPTADRRWAQLDNDLNTILKDTLKGHAAKKIKTMVSLVYLVYYDTFGAKEGKKPRPQVEPSSRQRQIKELRGKLQTFKKRWQEASGEERLALEKANPASESRDCTGEAEGEAP